MMKDKTKKFHKTAKDYKARRLGILGGFLAAAGLGIFIPLMNEYAKENIVLTRQIEVLNNNDVQVKDVPTDLVNEVLAYREFTR